LSYSAQVTIKRWEGRK